MKAILISIRPEWVKKIASGEKTIEVRKSAPKEVPFKAYIYCTGITDKKHCRDEFDIGMWKGNEHVIGEFVCDKVIRTCGWRLRGDTQQCAKRTHEEESLPRSACLTIDEIVKYAGGENCGIYGWHISGLKIYDKPKELSEFWGRKNCLAADTVECWNCFATCLEINGRHCQPLTRPPQSWQYIEEL